MLKLLFSLIPFYISLHIVTNVNSVPIKNSRNSEETAGYFEGDMMGENLERVVARAGIINRRYRWPNGVIPYEFEPNYPQTLRLRFELAMSHISSRTCITFKQRSTEKDYIIIKSGPGCASFVGRIGGKQDLRLSGNCKLGSFIHELIHAIGFHHEQSRTDRDSFVRINRENISPGQEVNFRKYESNIISPFGLRYDYQSVMHYGAHAFSRNGRKTIEPLSNGIEIGQRRDMSPMDAQKINNMYCP